MAQHPAVDRFSFERALRARGLRRIAGVDEAGRGPLAGPVVAAAVVLPDAMVNAGLPAAWEGLNDSKQIPARRRDWFFAELTRHPHVRFAIGEVGPDIIDSINILRATHQAMAEALARLDPPPEHILVDGLPVKSLAFPQTAIVQGDARSYAIAAASILAKVTRDRRMEEYDRQYPEYGFARHKGYGTRQHFEAIARHGPCPIHRRSFVLQRPLQTELFP